MTNLITLILGGLTISGAVGLLTGIFGVGGGFLLTPALVIFLHVPFPIAVGTGLAVILATSTFSIIKRRGSGTVDIKLALTISIGSIVGVGLGQQLIAHLQQMPPLMIMGRPQDPTQYLGLCLFVVLLAWIAGYLAFDYKRNGGRRPDKRVGAFARLKLGPSLRFASLEEPELPLLPLIALGIGVGVLMALLGIGGGVVLLPSLVYLVGQRAVKAAGTSLMLVWISSLFAVLLKGKGGEINGYLLLAMLVGGITGAHFGNQIGLTITGPKIRLYFVFVVAATMVMIVAKLAWMTFATAPA